MSEQILTHTKQAKGSKTLSCHRAHVLAEDLAISLLDIGRVCNDQDIKIVDCQLGCFGDKTGV
ncbi:MAG: hypothetical protein GY809_31395 [Planctomycetes bacterium]|nr:hypothetical protein [Planctomycetota bacterium]